MNDQYVTKQFARPFDKSVLTCRADERVSAALSRSSSSHEPVFVIDEVGNFMGLIAPYQTLYYSRYPYLTLVQHCIFHPPRVDMRTPLYDVAQFMLFSKMYTLPVFENDKVTHIIRANDMLKGIIQNRKLLKEVADQVRIQKPITAGTYENVSVIYEMIRKRQNPISRIILTDRQGDLAGIVSRRDLQDAFSAKPPRERFGRLAKDTTYAVHFDEEEITRRDSPISMFMKEKVLTARHDVSSSQLLKTMIQKDIHSIVLVKGLKPVGFASRHDFLKAVAALKPEQEFPIIWHDSKHTIGMISAVTAYSLIDGFVRKFDKRYPIKHTAINFNETKNAAGYVKLYRITLHILLKSGKLLLGKVQHKNLMMGIRKAIGRIEKQVDLSDRQKHETK